VTVLPIRTAGDPVLRRVTEPVQFLGSNTALQSVGALVDDMFDTLLASGGAGLSANQIGTSLRVFVFDCPENRGDTQRRRGAIINPALECSPIPQRCPDPEGDLEGCLSVPGMMFPIVRADWARVHGADRDGAPVTIEGSGLFARLLQHEVAHLNGSLYVDQLVEPYAAQAIEALAGTSGSPWTPGVGPHPFGAWMSRRTNQRP
jgi:peptide deformylase